MEEFAALLDALVYTSSRNAKLKLLADYLRLTPDPDRGWALAALVPGSTPDVEGSLVSLRVPHAGRELARLLRALGADVTVCARREETLFEAAAEGCHPLLVTASDPMSGMALLCRDHTILFNTVPAHILPRDLLMGLQPDTLLIDLASAPFGVSDDHVREAAAQNGLRYLRAPSLPGSYAPRDAGRAIAECILGLVTHRDSSDETNREGGTPT
jgi:hypothetical protein